MQQKLQRKRYILPGLLAVLLFSAFFVLFDWKWSSPAIMLIAAAAAGAMIWAKNGRLVIKITFFHLWMLVLSGYCFLSTIWAWDPANAMTKGISVFSMFLCYSVALLCYQEYDSVDSLLKAVMWGGIIVMMVIIGTFGVGGILSLLRYDDRLSEQFYLNSNTVGVLCAISVTVNCYYILREKRLHWWNIFIISGVLIIASTGSRQALALMAGGIVLLFLLVNMQGKSPYEIAIILLAGIILIAALLLLIARLPAFSGIYKRMLSMIAAVTGVGKTDRSATTRLALIHAGLLQFRQTPVLGIGMGSGHLVAWKYVNRTYYLHNNFVEILSGGGLIGFVIYYSIYLWILGNYIRFRRYATTETIICFTLLIMMLVEDYAAVTYYLKETFFYLMICSLEVEKMRRTCQESIQPALCLVKPRRCLI